MTKYLTQEGLAKLKEELGHLEKTKRKEVSEKLKQAVSQGDLSENAAYDAAKEEQGFIEGKIRDLKNIIVQAKLIVDKKSNGRIEIGSIAALFSKDGREEFRVVGPEEADVLNNKISFQSPLGSALLDKKRGDIVEINTPGGKKQYKVIAVK
ncbi:MAG: transcription elongation factor GreA [Candidatus Wildermuthbacteria bacterium RIFCSPLOWO2_12_FULL_40_9]|uniref:Transcription elongation factor GreA n=2 Tax=Candidatus Wildermuthiibacteriota TaxID=1817923 RepID=A0A1G2RDI7_9BACT|nr:MAG: transcription elongation factor GreA [Candidatus Wildermuthbacteria bacterium RIFCSPHIGHO2_12_FULL_40_12]OHA76806.1 MAG: transcription elongation factor GreA [Candidatus Wildermuthbacteria bacterium RIFCSPLOWO2_12_FULL_40_9]